MSSQGRITLTTITPMVAAPIRPMAIPTTSQRMFCPPGCDAGAEVVQAAQAVASQVYGQLPGAGAASSERAVHKLLGRGIICTVLFVLEGLLPPVVVTLMVTLSSRLTSNVLLSLCHPSTCLLSLPLGAFMG